MENIIEFYETDICVLKLKGWVRRVARIMLIVALFVCLYINGVLGMRYMQERSVRKFDAQISTVPIPGNDVKTLPYKDISCSDKDIMVVPEVLVDSRVEEGIDNKHDEIVGVEMNDNPVISSDNEVAYDSNIETGPTYPQIIIHGNGGFPEKKEIQLDTQEVLADSLEKPKRLGKEFDNWYVNPECTIPFNGILGKTETINIYAGWREFRGFISNDEGLITGYTDSGQITFSGELVLPTNDSCIGVQEGALSGVEDLVEGIYIPRNIISLPDGVFDKFPRLMYIYVDQGNPIYKSINGVLYTLDDTLVCLPQGQIINE